MTRVGMLKKCIIGAAIAAALALSSCQLFTSFEHYTNVQPDTDAESGIIFVTSVAVSPAFGGVQRADDKCTATANAAGNDLAGRHWKAWLGDDMATPSEHVKAGSLPRYVRVDGFPVGDLTDLAGGTLQYPVDVDEFGVAREAGIAWTGSSFGGNCGNWTNDTDAASGEIGLCGVQNIAWTENGIGTCNQSLSLYCVEQKQ